MYTNKQPNSRKQNNNNYFRQFPIFAVVMPPYLTFKLLSYFFLIPMAVYI